MTKTEIVAAITDYCNLTSPTAVTRVGKAVDRHYRRITSTLGLDAARFVTRSASMSIGVQTVTFTEIEKIDRILDVTDGVRRVDEASIHEIRSTQPGASQPTRWALQNTDADSVVVLFDTVPQSVYSLQADGWTTLAALSGTDEPAFPESFHDILVWFVLGEELLKKEKDKLAATYVAKAEKLLAELRFHLADSPTKETQQASAMARAAAGGSGGGGGTVGGSSYTQTGLVTFDRDPSAPFAVTSGSAAVDNLAVNWASVEKTVSSLADITTRSASALSSGTLPDARFPATLPAVSGANLTALNASSLGSGTVPDARFPAVLPAVSGANLTNLPAASAVLSICDGRLTATSGVPVTTADVTGATSIYFAPYTGNQIALYDGASTWNVRTFTEIAISLSGFTASKPYDIFAYDNAGTVTIETLVWTNATTRATALTTQNGVLVKSGATTRRWLGSIYINASGGQTDDSYLKRNISNYYHRVPRPMRVLEATVTWVYSTATFRQANGAAGNQLEVMIGWPEGAIEVDIIAYARNSTSGQQMQVAVGEDSTTVAHAGNVGRLGVSHVVDSLIVIPASLRIIPAVGRHLYVWLELGTGSGTTTWLGVAGGQSGISGVVFG